MSTTDVTSAGSERCCRSWCIPLLAIVLLITRRAVEPAVSLG
ncbi:hypothetical protein ACWEOI_20680 [Nocardia sp. NPDC004340]